MPKRTRNAFWEFKVANTLPRRGLVSEEQAKKARAAWKSANPNKSTSDSSIHPIWSFERFGQTETRVQDGRILFVGGEHTDRYDPDVFIYNDPVVLNPNDRIDIFCYPGAIFPPTDFHSATLFGRELLLVGSVGYPGERDYKRTQVLRLDTKRCGSRDWKRRATGPAGSINTGLRDTNMSCTFRRATFSTWLRGEKGEPRIPRSLCSTSQR